MPAANESDPPSSGETAGAPQSATDTSQESGGKHRAKVPDWRPFFAMFLAGFVILVLAGKWNMPERSALFLKFAGAALCGTAFLFARRARPSAKR